MNFNWYWCREKINPLANKKMDEGLIGFRANSIIIGVASRKCNLLAKKDLGS